MEEIEKRTEAELELAGYLVFLERYAGSKSARLFPKLIPFDGGDDIWVRHHDDDSFNHSTLRPWQRQCVQVKGSNTSDGVFIIHEINQAADPITPHE
jgi:hypothetical protein